METIICSFMRVQRRLTTTQEVTSLIADLASSGHVDLTPEDRLAVVDLPDADAVASNISSVMALTRSALIERAAQSPELLTEAELYLLFDRYWMNISRSKKRTLSDVSDVIILISLEHKEATMEQLRLLRNHSAIMPTSTRP